MTMDRKTAIRLFEDRNIRVVWDDDQEKWFFSVVDVIAILTASPSPRKYWTVLKLRLKKEGSQLTTNCSQLKMKSADGKFYKADALDTENLLRLIQSVPSPKAEPFKLWLAKVGRERLDEIADPELTIDRALATYLKKGYSANWINQRLKTIEVRKEMTDEWERAGVKEGLEYAILTDEITKAWSGMTTKEYKKLKELKKENLRDNMTNLELVLNMLAEVTTTELSKQKSPKGLGESRKVAQKGGQIAGEAREKIEKETGKKVTTSLNARKTPKLLDE